MTTVPIMPVAMTTFMTAKDPSPKRQEIVIMVHIRGIAQYFGFQGYALRIVQDQFEWQDGYWAVNVSLAMDKLHHQFFCSILISG